MALGGVHGRAAQQHGEMGDELRGCISRPSREAVDVSEEVVIGERLGGSENVDLHEDLVSRPFSVLFEGSGRATDARTAVSVRESLTSAARRAGALSGVLR